MASDPIKNEQIEILKVILPQADSAETEKIVLSERDALRVLDLLANPPEPNARLLRAAKAGFTLP
jgi:uncharacterized protein (DUF1778 family)